MNLNDNINRKILIFYVNVTKNNYFIGMYFNNEHKEIIHI